MFTSFRRLAVAERRLATDKSRYQPVIGLEVHIQLSTRTKLFSRSPISDGPPNRRVVPFDMAAPGILPLLNRRCVLHALKMAILMRCRIPDASRFDRKHYFYADMPAGYQITQHEAPIAKDGKYGFYVFDEHVEPYWKEIDIIQLQLEQDSGKTIHVENRSLVDYNRAGCALVELVTTPCFSTALEAVRFVEHLRLLLMHHRLCDGELHRGHMRVDANVSLSFDGHAGVRTEIKNMNSIRTIHTAINYEIARQFEILSSGSGSHVVNETRAADSEGRTVAMREKDAQTDYRFLPEPNLPKLVVKQEWIDEVREELAAEGRPKFQILRDDVGFDPRSAVHISEDPFLINFVDKCLKFKDPSVTANDILYWMKELKTSMQRSKGNYPPQSEFFVSQFTKLVKLARDQRLTRLRLLEFLRLYSSETDPETRDIIDIIEENDFWRIRDTQNIDRIVEECMAKNGKLAEKLKIDGGKNAKSFNKMRNFIVDSTRKCIEIDDVEAAIRRNL